MKAQTVKNAVIVPVGAKGGFVVKRPPGIRPRRGRSGGARRLPHLHPRVARAHRQPGRRSRRAARGRRAPRRRRPLPRRRGRQGHRLRSPTSPTSSPPSTATGSATRSRRVGRRASTTRRWASRRAARGSRCARTSVPWASTPTPRALTRRRASATCRATCSATACCGRRTCSWSPRSTTATCSSIPIPIPAASFAERQRLFALPASSWADYDPTVLSAGGGVFARSAKSVDLTPAARARARHRRPAADPDELVRAMLRAPVDLLWNGGIGTFVKATHGVRRRRRRSHQRRRARRRHRAAVPGGRRGRQPRASRNAARVEYALAGGRINTDAIDNSAGVDCSDHEVNIKILLQRRHRGGCCSTPRSATRSSCT